MPRSIEVPVSPRGETPVHTRGDTGGACREASRFVERALGRRTAGAMITESCQGQAAEQALPQSP